MGTKTEIIKRQILTLIVILMTTFHGIAQTAKTDDTEKGFKDRLWYGVSIGNIGLSNNSFYTNLSLIGGIKLTDDFRVGAIVHGYYTYLWSRGNKIPNRNIFEYGFGGLVSYTFYRNIFFQIEVDQMYLYKNYYSRRLERNPYLFTYIGGGYQYTSMNDWSFTISLMYNANPDSNSQFFPIDYRGTFVYNF